MSGTGGQIPKNSTKDAPGALITQEIARILGALCQGLGDRDQYIFSIVFHPPICTLIQRHSHPPTSTLT